MLESKNIPAGSDLLLNTCISLSVSQSQVDKSLALHAHDFIHF